jgi:hypothetical protein
MLGLMSCGAFWQMARNKKIIKRLYISFPESFSVKIAGQFRTKRLSQRNLLVETVHVKHGGNFPSWVRRWANTVDFEESPSNPTLSQANL